MPTGWPLPMRDFEECGCTPGAGECSCAYDCECRDRWPHTPCTECEAEGWYNQILGACGRDHTCQFCGGRDWVNDENWSAEYPGEQREEGSGLIRCPVHRS